MNDTEKIQALDNEIKELKTLKNEIERKQPGHIEVYQNEYDPEDPRVVNY